MEPRLTPGTVRSTVYSLTPAWPGLAWPVGPAAGSRAGCPPLRDGEGQQRYATRTRSHAHTLTHRYRSRQAQATATRPRTGLSWHSSRRACACQPAPASPSAPGRRVARTFLLRRPSRGGPLTSSAQRSRRAVAGRRRVIMRSPRADSRLFPPHSCHTVGQTRAASARARAAPRPPRLESVSTVNRPYHGIPG